VEIKEVTQGRSLVGPINILYNIQDSQGGKDVYIGISGCNTEDGGSMYDFIQPLYFKRLTENTSVVILYN
jgi:hypothetical protein